MTTVQSRRDDLLPRTLESLRAGGFDSPRLCVDGVLYDPTYRQRWPELEVTFRQPQIRVHGNWTMSLYEIFIRDPNADKYLVAQDDFLMYRNLRQYLEACHYPEKGYWNLYTFPSNEGIAPPGGGWYEAGLINPDDPERRQTGRGAVALVFSREAVLTLLSSRHMVERPLDCHRGWRAVDGGIVTAMNKAGWREMVHFPSLVQHTGEVSAMQNKPHAQAASFRGDDYDAMGLLT